MLCFLINNLIESDDYLNLVEEKLLLSNTNNILNKIQNNKKIDPNVTA